MYAVLNNLSIRTRMILSVMLLLATILAAVYNAYSSIEVNAHFNEKEIMGNQYQRPLSKIMHNLASLRVLSAQAEDGRNVTDTIQAATAEIDSFMKEVKDAQDAVGIELQFTDEGLGSRGREALKYETVLAKWENTAKSLRASPGAGHEEAIASMIADMRGMIAHSGDTSNLILDPDLDSYYLMDVTLLVFPQTLDRLSSIGKTFYEWLSPDHVMTQEERTEAAVLARMLKEADVDRIVADMDVSFKEDPNFQGESATYKKIIEPLLEDYKAKNIALVDLINKVGAGEAVDLNTFVSTWNDAKSSAFAFWYAGFQELDIIIDTRVKDYRNQQKEVLLIAAVGITVSLLFYTIVVMSLTGPLSSLTSTMKRLADQDLEAQVPYSDAKSEIGDIARAVNVFKLNAVEKIQLEHEQKQIEERAKVERKEAMRALAQSFESRVQGIVDSVASASTQLSQTAQVMNDFIGKSIVNAGDAVGKAEDTFMNVQSVASAAEEMSVTIQQISTQVQQSNGLITSSVEQVKGADEFAAALKAASNKVRDVTRFIADIAGQINMLALNATIESARAGEAGKGFAVVANEVRNLAGQTDKSAKDIEQVITEMNAASEGVIAALTGIKDSVDKIYTSSGEISSVVREQSLAVDEIARNMQIAAQGTESVTRSIRDVSHLSSEANQSSNQVLVASKELSQQAEQLDMEVGSFLSEVRAA